MKQSRVRPACAVLAGATVGISVVVLVLLFAFQRYGTSRMGHAFAPVVILWLSLNAAIGIHNLVQHGGEVWCACSCMRVQCWLACLLAHVRSTSLCTCASYTPGAQEREPMVRD